MPLSASTPHFRHISGDLKRRFHACPNTSMLPSRCHGCLAQRQLDGDSKSRAPNVASRRRLWQCTCKVKRGEAEAVLSTALICEALKYTLTWGHRVTNGRTLMTSVTSSIFRCEPLQFLEHFQMSPELWVQATSGTAPVLAASVSFRITCTNRDEMTAECRWMAQSVSIWLYSTTFIWQRWSIYRVRMLIQLRILNVFIISDLHRVKAAEYTARYYSVTTGDVRKKITVADN